MVGEVLKPTRTKEDNAYLTSIPSEDEIKKVLFQIGALKSPRPDGCNPKFYQRMWDTVGADIVECTQKNLKYKSPLNAINNTFVVLIPKKTQFQNVNDVRPISLYNVVYKIVSKVVANRLKRVLNKIISPFQSAFVGGGFISANSIIAHEIMHIFKKKMKNKMIGLKRDMFKSYDRME